MKRTWGVVWFFVPLNNTGSDYVGRSIRSILENYPSNKRDSPVGLQGGSWMELGMGQRPSRYHILIHSFCLESGGGIPNQVSRSDQPLI